MALRRNLDKTDSAGPQSYTLKMSIWPFWGKSAGFDDEIAGIAGRISSDQAGKTEKSSGE
jgi:hypothetical protein